MKKGKIQPDGRGRSKDKLKKKEPLKKNKTPPPTISVLFVDQTKGGILAKRLQEAEDRLAAITGYRIRVTENSAGYSQTPILGMVKTAPDQNAIPAGRVMRNFRIVNRGTSCMKVIAPSAILKV